MGALGYTKTVLASAVADEGTVAIAYPTGLTQALLLGSTGGKVAIGNNDVYPQAASGVAVAFAFGASTITVTNNTDVTWAAGSELIASFGDTTNDGSYNADVRVMPAIAALTAASGTASDTIAAVGGSFTEATLNNINQSLATKINQLRAAILAAGIIVE